MHSLQHQTSLHHNSAVGLLQTCRGHLERLHALPIREYVPQRKLVVPQASKDSDSSVKDKPSRGAGLGDLSGPIGLSIGKSADRKVRRTPPPFCPWACSHFSSLYEIICSKKERWRHHRIREMRRTGEPAAAELAPQAMATVVRAPRLQGMVVAQTWAPSH